MTLLALVVLTEEPAPDPSPRTHRAGTADSPAPAARVAREVVVAAAATALLVLAAACVGFLVYNWHPAAIFMGDAGSTFIGFTLGGLSIATTYFTHGELGRQEVAVALPPAPLAAPLAPSPPWPP